MAFRGQWTLERQRDSEDLPYSPLPEVHLIEVLQAARWLYQSPPLTAMVRAGIKHGCCGAACNRNHAYRRHGSGRIWTNTVPYSIELPSRISRQRSEMTSRIQGRPCGLYQNRSLVP